MVPPTLEMVREALRRGPATPDALAARLGVDGGDRDSLMWALDEFVRRGAVASTAGADCGTDGLCSTSVPAVYSLPA